MKRSKKKPVQSTATISRVRRCFDYGNDGYDEMLGRLYPDEKPFEPKDKFVKLGLFRSKNYHSV